MSLRALDELLGRADDGQLYQDHVNDMALLDQARKELDALRTLGFGGDRLHLLVTLKLEVPASMSVTDVASSGWSKICQAVIPGTFVTGIDVCHNSDPQALT